MHWTIYISYGVAVFLGVVAGTAVNIATQWFIARRTEKQQLKNLGFEFEMNIGKINRWLEGLTEYHNAVNSDTLDSFFYWFDLSKFVVVTANNMFTSGTMYKYLTHKDIEILQTMFTQLSYRGEDYINRQVDQNKKMCDKAMATKDINYWERQFKNYKAQLKDLTERLS